MSASFALKNPKVQLEKQMDSKYTNPAQPTIDGAVAYVRITLQTLHQINTCDVRLQCHVSTLFLRLHIGFSTKRSSSAAGFYICLTPISICINKIGTTEID